MKISWGRFFIYSGLLSMAISTGVVLYWLNAPVRVLDIKNNPAPTYPSVLAPDSLIFVHIDYCKLHQANGTIRRFLISSSARIPLPLQKDNAQKNCQVIDYPLLIPKDTPPDSYYLQYTITYQVNPLREVVEEFRSQEFEVK